MEKTLWYLLLCFSLCSCSVLYRRVLGIDTTPRWQDKEDLIKSIKKRDLTLDIVLVMDTASFRNAVIQQYMSALQTLKEDSLNVDSLAPKKIRKIANDDLQPTQIRLFTNAGNEVFKIVNCYIDPPIPMNWNVDNCFDLFPPTIKNSALNIHHFNLSSFLSSSTKLNGDSVNLSQLPISDYYMLVLWNSYMVKPSKKAIKTVKRYIEDNPDQTITPIYINNHNAQLWGMLDSTQRQMIYEYEANKKNRE